MPGIPGEPRRNEYSLSDAEQLIADLEALTHSAKGLRTTIKRAGGGSFVVDSRKGAGDSLKEIRKFIAKWAAAVESA
jgi:hypothetical protein